MDVFGAWDMEAEVKAGENEKEKDQCVTRLSGPESAEEEECPSDLLELLVCPVTRGPLEYDRIRGELVSKSAGLAYPIRHGIPVMLPEEARELEDGESH